MADKDDSVMPDDDTDAGAAPAKKAGGIVGMLPSLLKWVAIALGAIILIVTVVVITMKVMGGNKTQQVSIPFSQEYTRKKEILDWYSSFDSVRTNTSDAVPASVVVQVALGYKKDDKAASTEISQRLIEIKAFLRQYFSERTVEELKPQNEDILRQQIRDRINDDILSESKIRDVQFTTKDVVEQ